VTAPTMQTARRAGWGGPSSPSEGSLVAAMLIMAALFLAHGLQCAAAADHGPGAMSHTLVAPVAADDVTHEGGTGHESEFTMLVGSLADPVATVGGRDVPGQAGVVCVAVLTAMGLWFLSARKSKLPRQGAYGRLAQGATSQLRVAAPWRPPPHDLAVLCVLRT